MKGWIGWVLLGLTLLVAVAGYRNAQPEPETEQLARGTVCGAVKTCVVMSDRPSVVRTDVIRRRYQWTTSDGPVIVTCRREFYLAGAWGCTAAPGTGNELK